MGDAMLRLAELDERHNELLDRLAELDQQVSLVLQEWAKTKESLSERSSLPSDEIQPAAA